MRKKIDLIGRRFGKLIVLAEDALMYGRRTAWLCACDCGTKLRVVGEALKDGRTKSCGCYSHEAIGTRSLKHGHSRNRTRGIPVTKTYRAWCKAKSRCHNPKDPKFPEYGNRGIKMCKRWSEDFRNFLADMGECPPDMTLERKDVNGDYAPGNCIWTSWDDQRNNKQDTIWVLREDGARLSLSRFCRAEELPYKLIHARLQRETSGRELAADIVRKLGTAPRIQPRRGRHQFILK